MKELIQSMENLPILIKIILAIPALDIVWGIYRLCRGVIANTLLPLSLASYCSASPPRGSLI